MSVAVVQAVEALWRQFICRACGLVYDEAAGDPDSGIAPGTRFADIPDNWVCPLCGVTKADFEPHEGVAAARPVAIMTPPRLGASRRDPGVVIVGAGRAGWQMAEALRLRDADLPVTIVTACDGAVYDKPLLSIMYAKGLDVATLARESGAAAAARLGVRLLADTEAVRIATAGERLRTTRGTLRWRHLVLAHGARPRSVAALPAGVAWRLNDRAAYRRFREALGAPGESPHGVLIAGAGLVGCELANDLALGGHRVQLVDLAERPLAALLDTQASQALLASWRSLPIAFQGGVRIERMERDVDGVVRVACADGTSYAASQVVGATGLETASRLAASAGLAFCDGIIVDPRTLATRQPRIHALGDCISFDGRASRYIEPIARQAQRIAATIVGDEQPRDFDTTRPPIRIKTTSNPITIH